MEVLRIGHLRASNCYFEKEEYKTNMLCIYVVDQKSFDYHIDLIHNNAYYENAFIAIYVDYKLTARVWTGKAEKLSLNSDIDYTFDNFKNSIIYNSLRTKEVKLKFHNKKVDKASSCFREDIEYIEVLFML